MAEKRLLEEELRQLKAKAEELERERLEKERIERERIEKENLKRIFTYQQKNAIICVIEVRIWQKLKKQSKRKK